MASARPLPAFILIVIFLAACTAQPSPTASPILLPTATPSATRLPSATPAPPTRTATPTLTPRPTATLKPTPILPAYAGTPVLDPAGVISAGTAKDLRLLARWGSGAVADLAWSPDGGWLAVKTYSGTYLFSGGALGQPHLIEGNAVFGPGDLLAAYTPEGAIHVWNTTGWKAAYSLNGTRPVFSPDGKLLAALDGDVVRVVSAADGFPVAALSLPGADRLYFSPDGSLLVASSRSEVHVWQSSDFSQAFTSNANRIMRSSFNPDGSLFFIQSRDPQGTMSLGIRQVEGWSQDGTIQTTGTYLLQPDGKQAFLFSNYPTAGQVTIYSLPEGKQIGQFQASGSIYRMAISPDSKTLALSLPDPNAGALGLYDTTGNLIKKVTCEHSCDAGLPVFSADGTQVYMTGRMPTTGMEVGVTAVYRTKGGGLVRMLRGTQNLSGEIDQLAVAPDGAQVAVYAGGAENMLYVFGTDGKLEGSQDWGAQTLALGNLSADDAQAAVFNDRTTVKLPMRLADGSEVRQYEHATLPLFSNGNFLLTTELRNGKFAALHLWQAGSGESVALFSPNFTPPLVFSATDDLAVDARDSVVRLIQLPSGKMVSSFIASGQVNVHLNTITFSPDGSLIAAGDTAGDVWLWRVADRQVVFNFPGGGSPLVGLAFSPDGSFLAEAAADGSLEVRSASDGQAVVSLNLADGLKAALGPDVTFNNLGGMAYSADGKLLAASGMLNPLQSFPNRAPVVVLLQASDGKLLQILQGGGGSVAFTMDGKKLVASGDGSVQVWGVIH